MSKKATKQSRRTRARKERQRLGAFAVGTVERSSDTILPVMRAMSFGDRNQIMTIEAGVLAIMAGVARRIPGANR